MRSSPLWLLATSVALASLTLRLRRRWQQRANGRAAIADQRALPPPRPPRPPPPPPPPPAPEPIVLVQAALRGWYTRICLGPRAQAMPPHGSGLSIRVCGAVTCCQRGAEDVKIAIEDLCPPGAARTGSSPCLQLCGAGPNVSCSRAHERPMARTRVDGIPAVLRLLRSVGLHVHPALRTAAARREQAQAHAHGGRHRAQSQAAAEGLAALDGAGALGGGVCGLRLRHKLLLLRAEACRAQSDTPVAHAAEGYARLWLGAASEAAAVQRRLARAHEAGPMRAQAASGGPRLPPALLLAAQAHARLGERASAAALLEALRRPPHEPPETRAHRVRRDEARAIDELMGRLAESTRQ